MHHLHNEVFHEDTAQYIYKQINLTLILQRAHHVCIHRFSVI